MCDSELPGHLKCCHEVDAFDAHIIFFEFSTCLIDVCQWPFYGIYFFIFLPTFYCCWYFFLVLIISLIASEVVLVNFRSTLDIIFYGGLLWSWWVVPNFVRIWGLLLSSMDLSIFTSVELVDIVFRILEKIILVLEEFENVYNVFSFLEQELWATDSKSS